MGTRQVLKRQSDEHLKADLWEYKVERQREVSGGCTTHGDVAGSISWLGFFLHSCEVALCLPPCVLYCSMLLPGLTVTHSFQAACLDWICLPRPRRKNRVFFLLFLQHWGRPWWMRFLFPKIAGQLSPRAIVHITWLSVPPKRKIRLSLCSYKKLLQHNV